MANKNKINTFINKLVPNRAWVQLAFLLIFLDPFALRLHNICGPVFHCYSCPLATFACPIGILANFSALHLFPFFALGILILLGVLFGSLICGWLCPFGFLQDLASKVPTPKLEPPAWTSCLRFVVLFGLVLFIPYFFGKSHPLFICSVCPAGAIEASLPSMVGQAFAGQNITLPNTLKLIIVIMFLIAIFFVNRPWCRMFCPLGAIFSIFNRFSVFFLKLDTDKCSDCSICHNLCKYGGKPNQSTDDFNCLRCLECTQCKKDALTIGTLLDK
jgi:polyferredoxin